MRSACIYGVVPNKHACNPTQDACMQQSPEAKGEGAAGASCCPRGGLSNPSKSACCLYTPKTNMLSSTKVTSSNTSGRQHRKSLHLQEITAESDVLCVYKERNNFGLNTKHWVHASVQVPEQVVEVHVHRRLLLRGLGTS